MMWKIIFCVLSASFSNWTFVTGQGRDPDLTIFLSNWSPGKILRLSRDGLNSQLDGTQVTQYLPRPVAIDYDPVEQKIYYTDVTRKRIGRINAQGGSLQTLKYLTRSSTPDGLALDIGARKLFYTDTGLNIIASMNMNGTNTTTHLTRFDGIDNPRAIILDTKRMKIFWTDWGVTPYIATATYDGNSVKKIIETGLGWPNGLAIDQQNKILFWCDAKTDKIESSFLDGSNRKVLLQEPTPHYFDIVFHDRTLYFTDWRRKAVLTMSAHGGPVRQLKSSLITQPAGLYVLSDTVTACPKGTYGIYCEHKCGKCTGGTCNNVTGSCPSGCLLGYQGHNCNTTCQRNSYGHSCTPCGQCSEGASCDERSGYCLTGCQLGWRGYRCDIRCLSNTYGPHCVDCGHCAGTGRQTCEQSTGHCIDGCSDGWTGPLCKSKVSPESKDQTAVIAGTVGGSMAFIFIVLIIVIAVVVFLTRRSKNSNRHDDHETPHNQFFSPTMALPPSYSTSNVMTGVRYSSTNDQASLVTTQSGAFGVPPETLPDEEKRPLP